MNAAELDSFSPFQQSEYPGIPHRYVASTNDQFGFTSSRQRALPDDSNEEEKKIEHIVQCVGASASSSTLPSISSRFFRADHIFPVFHQLATRSYPGTTSCSASSFTSFDSTSVSPLPPILKPTLAITGTTSTSLNSDLGLMRVWSLSRLSGKQLGGRSRSTFRRWKRRSLLTSTEGDLEVSGPFCWFLHHLLAAETNSAAFPFRQS